MDPRTLFPILAVAFALLALWQLWRTRQWRGRAAIWAWLALAFGGVAWWLQRAAS